MRRSRIVYFLPHIPPRCTFFKAPIDWGVHGDKMRSINTTHKRLFLIVIKRPTGQPHKLPVRHVAGERIAGLVTGRAGHMDKYSITQKRDGKWYVVTPKGNTISVPYKDKKTAQDWADLHNS